MFSNKVISQEKGAVDYLIKAWINTRIFNIKYIII